MVLASRSMRRRLVRVFTGLSTVRPMVACRVRAIDTLEVATCRSPQLRPASSPRRIPVWATRCSAGIQPQPLRSLEELAELLGVPDRGDR